jgi:transcriptional regulator with XRE-family HTH domain
MNESKHRIKQLRKQFALTQKQYAKRIGRTKGYISNIENGHAGMSSTTVSSICSAFEVREEWLREGNGELFTDSLEHGVNTAGIDKRIRDVRKKAGLTQQEFADRIGYHKNQVSNVETGRFNPSNRFLASVGEKFMVSVDWLRTGEADERDPVDDRLIKLRTLHLSSTKSSIYALAPPKKPVNISFFRLPSRTPYIWKLKVSSIP